jgi:hypothetical protein
MGLGRRVLRAKEMKATRLGMIARNRSAISLGMALVARQWADPVELGIVD